MITHQAVVASFQGYPMKISPKLIPQTCPESDIFESLLALNHQNILELGCGDASLTKLIAITGEGRTITATEVDKTQHNKNTQNNNLSNVTFKLAGGEEIPVESHIYDTAFMFKSLHHIPLNSMDKALQEVSRVLKKGAMAYISEPIFTGDFNEVLRLFHDEQRVREAAFESIKKAVDNGIFSVENEVFFNSPIFFESFKQFQERVIGVTHTSHKLSPSLLEQVREKFETFFKKNNGYFVIPIRVNLLKNISES